MLRAESSGNQPKGGGQPARGGGEGYYRPHPSVPAPQPESPAPPPFGNNWLTIRPRTPATPNPGAHNGEIPGV